MKIYKPKFDQTLYDRSVVTTIVPRVDRVFSATGLFMKLDHPELEVVVGDEIRLTTRCERIIDALHRAQTPAELILAQITTTEEQDRNTYKAVGGVVVSICHREPESHRLLGIVEVPSGEFVQYQRGSIHIPGLGF